MEARHFPDRRKSSNDLSNLSWAPYSVNQRDRWAHGTDNRGEKHYAARLTADAVRIIRSEWTSHTSTQRELADRFGVSQSTISTIISRKRWASVL
jgi:DNA invertase Pin-like site-specific DNA recombinase